MTLIDLENKTIEELVFLLDNLVIDLDVVEICTTVDQIIMSNDSFFYEFMQDLDEILHSVLGGKVQEAFISACMHRNALTDADNISQALQILKELSVSRFCTYADDIQLIKRLVC